MPPPMSNSFNEEQFKESIELTQRYSRRSPHTPTFLSALSPILKTHESRLGAIVILP